MKDARDLQFWGMVAVVGAALAVVAAYLADGAALVWVVASVEALLVMVHVARRFRRAGHPPVHAERHEGRADAAHCERCRRARELGAEAVARRDQQARQAG
ncbi:hypothetical protein [Kitasatospora sp. GAS204B]|uniref:hypothetical protein n=1 Tax=unclassified Kitasatospora TaxID=2633591 RepID=UPI0024769066|nr:hypothetical protein [Kitasatospora sp. GAS204B]MDH6116615.1 hypothetical protein [Kitasatospora sp. GAS204B]